MGASGTNALAKLAVDCRLVHARFGLGEQQLQVVGRRHLRRVSSAGARATAAKSAKYRGCTKCSAGACAARSPTTTPPLARTKSAKAAGTAASGATLPASLALLCAIPHNGLPSIAHATLLPLWKEQQLCIHYSWRLYLQGEMRPLATGHRLCQHMLLSMLASAVHPKEHSICACARICNDRQCCAALAIILLPHRSMNCRPLSRIG